MMVKQNLLYIVFFLLHALVLISSARAADPDIIKKPIPDWVKHIPPAQIRNIPEDQIQSGIHYLLSDSQFKVNPNEEPHNYRHFADYIVNQTGVERASQINISYDPSYQKVILHTLQIVRAGKVLDKMDTARMKLIQREEDMDNLIYNGQLSLNIILDDVRVGDVIEYGYSRVGMNPVYDNIFAHRANLSWAVPVAKVSVRLLWNKPSTLHSEVVNSDLKLERSETKEGIEFLIQGENIQPVLVENNTPSWFKPWGKVYFSEINSWEDVANWGMTLYDDVLVANDGIKKLISDIKTKHSDPEQQISAALRFVQDEIRYLGIELGQNSHKPNIAYETLENRYGDCKDKTVLFQTILKGLDIQASPALVNTRERIEPYLPSIHSFDHVITYVEHEGKKYWLDPTLSHQYGQISKIHQPDYGYALVLRDNTKELTKMSPTPSKSGIYTKDIFSLTDTDHVELTTTSKYYGHNAERKRGNFESKGRDKIQQEYLEFFQGYYPDINVREVIQHEDNADENILVSTEKYAINDFWTKEDDKEKLEADFFPYMVSSLIKTPSELERKHPLYLKYPNNEQHIIEIHLPKGKWVFDNESFIEDNDFFTFKYEALFNETDLRLILSYTYESKVDHIPSEKYQNYFDALKRSSDYRGYNISKDISSESVVPTESGFFSNLSSTHFILLYFGLFAIAIIWWLIERKFRPSESDAIYYPITISKLIVMWVITFGIYAMYWFYKNFRYIEDTEKKGTMPKARGVFCYFWYYPLWENLNNDSLERRSRTQLPNQVIAIILAISFFIITCLAERITGFTILPILLSVLLVLPLANYILHINTTNSQALANNSRWRLRHYFLTAISTPILLLSLGAEVGLLASDSVIKGNRILQHDIKFLQRNGILNPTDKIDYFYSDSFIFIRNDGNGFTERHVFSYWKNENEPFKQEQATYAEIKDIKINKNSELNENSIVTIVRQDDSEFLLFISNTDKKDELFINELQKRWKNHKEAR